MSRGRFIVLEGVDGSGKTTQAGLLEKRLKNVLRAREPGGTTIGESIREILRDSRRTRMTPLAELFLFMASRAQLLDEIIRPALKQGRTVLLDRYYYSTAAYQGAASGLEAAGVLELAERVARFEKPDLVIVLDLDPKAGLERSSRPRDRMERKGLEFLKSVRQAFLKIAKRDPRRFKIVSADRSVEEVHEEIYEAVKKLEPMESVIH